VSLNFKQTFSFFILRWFKLAVTYGSKYISFCIMLTSILIIMALSVGALAKALVYESPQNDVCNKWNVIELSVAHFYLQNVNYGLFLLISFNYTFQFEDIGSHGTKILIYNLWLNDEGIYELSFDDDDEVYCLYLNLLLYELLRLQVFWSVF
jgi:hypothetical protein